VESICVARSLTAEHLTSRTHQETSHGNQFQNQGKAIPPTGKAYKIRMATIGHWNNDGVMDAEYLFWDNQEFMKEIGLGK
jgi:hypothetical protein